MLFFWRGRPLTILPSCEGEAVDAALWLVLVNYALVLNSSLTVPQVLLISIPFGGLGASPFFYYENMLAGEVSLSKADLNVLKTGQASKLLKQLLQGPSYPQHCSNLGLDVTHDGVWRGVKNNLVGVLVNYENGRLVFKNRLLTYGERAKDDAYYFKIYHRIEVERIKNFNPFYRGLVQVTNHLNEASVLQVYRENFSNRSVLELKFMVRSNYIEAFALMGREVFETTELSLEQRCAIVEGDGATVENLLEDQAQNADSRVNILQTTATARAALIGSDAFVKKFQLLLPRFNLSELAAFLEAENLWQDGLTLEFKTCYNVGPIEGFENRYEKQLQYLFKKPGPIAVVILGRCEEGLAEQCKAALEHISNKPAFKDAGITLYFYNEVQKRIL